MTDLVDVMTISSHYQLRNDNFFIIVKKDTDDYYH